MHLSKLAMSFINTRQNILANIYIIYNGLRLLTLKQRFVDIEIYMTDT